MIITKKFDQLIKKWLCISFFFSENNNNYMFFFFFFYYCKSTNNVIVCLSKQFTTATSCTKTIKHVFTGKKDWILMKLISLNSLFIIILLKNEYLFCCYFWFFYIYKYLECWNLELCDKNYYIILDLNPISIPQHIIFHTGILYKVLFFK